MNRGSGINFDDIDYCGYVLLMLVIVVFVIFPIRDSIVPLMVLQSSSGNYL